MKITTTLQKLFQSLQETVQEELPGLSEPEQDTLICHMALDILSQGKARLETPITDISVSAPKLALAN